MGFVVAAIAALTVTEVVVGLIAIVVLWEPVLKPALKAIAGLFGIKDHDVIKTNMTSQRMIDDATLNKFQSKLALKHQKQPDSSIIDKLQEVTASARGRVQGAYYKAKNYTTDGLPTTNIRARNIDSAALLAAIQTTVPNAIVIDSQLDMPTKEEYIHYEFQGLYGYNNLANTLTYNGVTQYLTGISYNYTTNQYDCTVTEYEDVTESTTTTTVVTVVILDATTDTVTTTVSDRVVVIGNTTGIIVSDTTTVTSTVVTTAPTGTVSASTVVGATTTNVVVNGRTVSTSVITHAAYNTVTYVIARYYTTNINDYSYWLYDIATGVFPNVDNSSSNKQAQDLLPVITIRNNLVNTEDTPKTGSLYKDTDKLLKVLGLDLHDLTTEIKKNPDIASVDDAFVHFGVSPSDQHPIVSRVLYETFYAIYADNALNHGSDGFMATYESGPMKLGMAWIAQSLVSTTGSIGKIGTYKHSIVGKDLIMQYQDNEFSYSTLTITNLNNVSFIARGALQGTSDKALSDPDFNIPVSYSLVQSLSSIDQTAFMAKALRVTFYSLVIQHIKWYQTGAFATFMQIVGVIVMVVGCIYTACLSNLTSTAVQNALIATVATGVALKLIVKYVHTPWLRALLTVVVIVAGAAYGGGFKGGMLSVQSLTTIVTAFGTGMSTYAQAGMEQLQERETVFQLAVSKRQKEIDEANKSMNQGLSLQDTTQLAVYDPVKQYITSTVDYMMYVARDVQYDFGLLYNYDIMTKDYYDNKLRVALT